ncbi:MAG: hypothetical protein HOV83_17390 [Catenulispora sp.]|nr:hypothetical protein [Catenulispora sp.]
MRSSRAGLVIAHAEVDPAVKAILDAAAKAARITFAEALEETVRNIPRDASGIPLWVRERTAGELPLAA